MAGTKVAAKTDGDQGAHVGVKDGFAEAFDERVEYLQMLERLKSIAHTPDTNLMPDDFDTRMCAAKP